MNNVITLDKINKDYWMSKINSLREEKFDPNKKITICLLSTIQSTNITPVHIVLFACLVEYFKRQNYTLSIKVEDLELLKFFISDLHFTSYFDPKEKIVHYNSSKDNILNLWKIETGREKEYSISVTNYFKRKYFKEFDLTIFQSSLDELYSNVADHSQANGIAFSYIHYDERDKYIHIAVCDFGLGIPTTLIMSKPGKYNSQPEALRDSLEIGVSAYSNFHNKGFGLDNVVSNLSDSDILRIISNKAVLFCMAKKEPIRFYPLDFDFRGTLIYFDVCINAFQSEDEILSDVTIG